MRKMYSKKQIEEIAKSSGTKLYKHILNSISSGYTFTLITTNPQPIDFSIIDTYEKLYEYLLNENVLQFLGKYNDQIMYDRNEVYFYSIQLTMIGNDVVCIPSSCDDWSLSDTTDNVIPL